MKEKIKITITDKEQTVIEKNFNSYDFFDKPFIELALQLGFKLKENTTVISFRLKNEIINKITDNELKYVLTLLLKKKHRFNLVNYQKFLNVLKKYNLGSFNKVYTWFENFKYNLCNCQSIEFERLQIEI